MPSESFSSKDYSTMSDAEYRAARIDLIADLTNTPEEGVKEEDESVYAKSFRLARYCSKEESSMDQVKATAEEVLNCMGKKGYVSEAEYYFIKANYVQFL